MVSKSKNKLELMRIFLSDSVKKLERYYPWFW